MRFTFFLTAFAVLLAMPRARAEEPFAFDKTPGQLPKSVVPVEYAIRITPDIAGASFSGEERITIEVLKPVREIVLNSLGLEITLAELGIGDPPPARLKAKRNEAKQTLTLTAPHELAPGGHVIHLQFRGRLTEQPRGLYITRYQTGAKEGRALTTQMEATDARRMFPCWDEPVYRAAFQLTAVVPSKDVAVSNMPVERETAREDGLKEVVFAKTPPMASYLVAFASGAFEELRDEIEGVQLRILTTPGKREQGRWAMESTKKILPFFNEYFGVKYPLPKLDQVAFPSTGASGMENWGAIFYNDSALLYDPAESSIATKQRVFEVVAHEIAHQWFGDLVTMAWWDNLWLNEGFASWMGTKATDHFNPEWKTWLRATGSKEGAMSRDARATTHPIQQPVANESQAIDAFDEITYSKGQAFLRMLESWLGEETFRDCIRAYFKEHANSSTTTADLWAAMEKTSGKPVRAFAAEWTEQPGFPVVNVRTCADGGVELTQERFTIHQKNPKPLKWKIPVVIGPATDAKSANVVLLEDKPVRACEGVSLPIKANLGDAGYYRVRYDPASSAALVKVAPSLGEIDRLNLLNDTLALAQAGRAPIVQYLHLVSALAKDDSPLVAGNIAGGIAFIDALRGPKKTGGAFDPWAIALLRWHLARLGWEPKPGEPALDAQLRGGLIGLLGRLGDEEVKRKALERFDGFREEQASLPGDLRDPVFSIVGMFGDETRHAQLHELGRKAESFEQKRMLYGAMTKTRNESLARKTLALSLTDELVPAQAAGLVTRVAQEREFTGLAWEFAKEHLDRLLAKVTALGVNEFVPGIFRGFRDASRADELEAFAKSKLPPDASPSVAKAVDDIRFGAELRARILPEIEAWCRSASAE